MELIYLFLSLLALAYSGFWILGFLAPLRHQVQESIELACTPEVCWEKLTDFATYPTWQQHIKAVQELEPNLWEEDYGRWRLIFRTLEAAPPFLLARKIKDQGQGFGGEWIFQLEQTPFGTRLTLTEKGWIQHRLFRGISHFLLGHKKSIRRFQAALLASFTPPPLEE